ncbi:MAG: hypothetical protein AAGA29_09830 [Planctomycetota bacterium]
MAWWYAIEGRRCCRVRHVDNRQHIDGTVRLILPLQQQDAGFELVGMFEVHDDHDGGVYLAQALSSWHESDAVVLSCTPLGTLVERPDPDYDDDWLVVPGRDPVPVLSRCEAYSHCPSGDHMRLEIASRDWDMLGWRRAPLRCCNCGRCGTDTDDLAAGVGGFTAVTRDKDNAAPPTAEVVALRQRRRSRVSVELASRGEDITTLIGHILSSTGLTHTPTPANGEEPKSVCALS